MFRQAPASGIHEVLVLTPDHEATFADLDDAQVGLVMAAIRDRLEVHARRPGVRYSQAIVNHGREAGASLRHPHGQLLGIPFVPGEVAEEEAGFRRFAGSCLLCTMIEAEVDAGWRVVHEDEHALVVCPFWSGTPYEMLALPKAHEGHLTDAKPGDLVAVGRALRDCLDKLRTRVDDLAYNLVFHTLPHHHDDEFHWHVHVLPRVASVVGLRAGHGRADQHRGPRGRRSHPALIRRTVTRWRASGSTPSSTRRPRSCGRTSSTSRTTSTG